VYGRPARSAPPTDEGQDADKAAVQPEKGSEEGTGAAGAAGATRSDANKEVAAANKEDGVGEKDPDDDIDLDSLPPLTAPPPPSPLSGTFGHTSLSRPVGEGGVLKLHQGER
jgi:hypothetical protein